MSLTCKNCNESFRKTRSWQLFCSSVCRYTWHEVRRKRALELFSERRAEERAATAAGRGHFCAECGSRKPFRRGLCRGCYDRAEIRLRHPFRYKRGAEAGRYTGGAYRDVLGREWILEPSHPKADKRGYVLRKYLIFETLLGRQLHKDEIICQRDGNNANLALENLRIGWWRVRGNLPLIRHETLEENLKRHEKQRREQNRESATAVS